MKLLLTLDFMPESGGIQRYLSDIVTHTFSAEDMVVTLLPGNCHPDDTHYPCRIVRLTFFGTSRVNKKLFLPVMAAFLIREILRHGPRLTVVAGNIYPALIAGAVSFAFSLKYRVYTYGTELCALKEPNSLRARMWRMALSRAQTVYYLSNATLNLLRECGSELPLQQWLPRIDLPAGPVPVKASDGDTVRLLCIGRLVRHKGHALLLESLKNPPSGLPWHLTVAGGGVQYGHLVSMVHKYALDSSVTIAGEVSQQTLEKLYEAADIFIFPSIDTTSAFEGFGIVLLEAMAYEAAIIATRSDAVSEVFNNCEGCADLVPAGDTQSLRNAIFALVADRERRGHMSRSALSFLKERYVWRR